MVKINPLIGFKIPTFKIFDTLDEKYAVSKKIKKTWTIKIEHKTVYWRDSIISLLNKKLGKKSQKNRPTLGFEIFIIIPCLNKFFELLIFFYSVFWVDIGKVLKYPDTKNM